MQEHDDITPAAWRLATLLRSHPWRVIAVIASVMLILGAALAGVVNANTSGSDIVVSTDDANRDEGASGKEGDGDSRAFEDDVENGKVIPVTVDVDGAVMNPNVIELPEGSRVQDAIEACGGHKQSLHSSRRAKGLRSQGGRSAEDVRICNGCGRNGRNARQHQYRYG